MILQSKRAAVRNGVGVCWRWLKLDREKACTENRDGGGLGMVRILPFGELKTKLFWRKFIIDTLVLILTKFTILTIRLNIAEKLKCGGGLPSKTE